MEQGKCSRGGFTLTEVLVTFGVIALLTAILLPAVMQSREAARLLQCKNNLHQIGVAAHSFHSQYGYIDTSWPLRDLLPLVDQSTVLDALETKDAATAPPWPPLPQTPAVYVCPDDNRLDKSAVQVSYLVSGGINLYDGDLSRRSNTIGVFNSGQRRFREITDGLSNTAMFAEHLVFLYQTVLVTPAQGQQNSLRVYWSTPDPFDTDDPYMIATSLMRASVNSTLEQGQPIQGISAKHVTIWYNHLLPPNNRAFVIDFLGGNWSYAIPATSNHPSGVNVLMCDGSVRFVSSPIDTRVWQAAGTIHGGDFADF